MSQQSLIFPVALFLIFFFFCVSSSFLPLRPPNFPAGITKFHLLLLNLICTVCVCVCWSVCVCVSVCSQTRRRSHAVNCPCHPRVTSRVGNLNEDCVSACPSSPRARGGGVSEGRRVASSSRSRKPPGRFPRHGGEDAADARARVAAN